MKCIERTLVRKDWDVLVGLLDEFYLAQQLIIGTAPKHALKSRCDDEASDGEKEDTPYKETTTEWPEFDYLCHIIEKTFMVGVKEEQNASIFTKGHYWTFLEGLKWMDKETNSTFKDIKEMKHTKRKKGKARAWIRIAIASNQLSRHLRTLRSHSEHLHKWYSSKAMFCEYTCTEAFFWLLESIEENVNMVKVNVNMQLDYDNLPKDSDWYRSRVKGLEDLLEREYFTSSFRMDKENPGERKRREEERKRKEMEKEKEKQRKQKRNKDGKGKKDSTAEEKEGKGQMETKRKGKKDDTDTSDEEVTEEKKDNSKGDMPIKDGTGSRKKDKGKEM